ncbi:Rv3235 family protein [Nocardioides sp. cx-173]|uniref:Rv3235 family protein n=1 Tax=Nocardioides sp. cx-173 TaxID=2898796 RepID=UPI001E34B667|nr:Rv3235 family protein [Nocardioides sp. cx-173]MCD4525359.1 Rv3235 family protein [Nocardioides sp. cx-173]UGB40845.1 Rv3235 family protein [Nocardioides sp. cx-173]
MPARTHRVVPIRLPVPFAATQGTLALDLLPRREPPVAPVVPITAGRRRTAEEWARRFAQATVEIVGGDRPAAQLVRWTSREVYADLDRRAVLVARAGGHTPGQGRVQPVRPRVLSVHTCFLHDAAFEAGIHVRYGERSRALAARFEARGQRWLCTALDWS